MSLSPSGSTLDLATTVTLSTVRLSFGSDNSSEICDRPRKAWFSLLDTNRFTTKHFSVNVPERGKADILPNIEGECIVIEVRIQSGESFKLIPPCRIEWNPNIDCHVREIKTTCLTVAKTKFRFLEVGDVVASHSIGNIVIGKNNGFYCSLCGKSFDDKKDVLEHFDIPDMQIRVVCSFSDDWRKCPVFKEFHPPRHSASFQKYVTACENPFSTPPFKLLPQLDANELRHKLNLLASHTMDL